MTILGSLSLRLTSKAILAQKEERQTKTADLSNSMLTRSNIDSSIRNFPKLCNLMRLKMTTCSLELKIVL